MRACGRVCAGCEFAAGSLICAGRGPPSPATTTIAKLNFLPERPPLSPFNLCKPAATEDTRKVYKRMKGPFACASVCVCACLRLSACNINGSKSNGTCAHLYPTRRKAVKAPAFQLSDSKPVASQHDELCKETVRDFRERTCPCVCARAHESVYSGHGGVFPVRERRGIHRTLPGGLWKRD